MIHTVRVAALLCMILASHQSFTMMTPIPQDNCVTEPDVAGWNCYVVTYSHVGGPLYNQEIYSRNHEISYDAVYHPYHFLERQNPNCNVEITVNTHTGYEIEAAESWSMESTANATQSRTTAVEIGLEHSVGASATVGETLAVGINIGSAYNWGDSLNGSGPQGQWTHIPSKSKHGSGCLHMSMSPLGMLR